MLVNREGCFLLGEEDLSGLIFPEYDTCFQKISSLLYTYLLKLSSLYAIHFNMQQIRLNCN